MKKLNIKPEWITAIAACITCLSLVVFVWGVIIDQNQRERQMAVEVIKGWNDALEKDNFRYANLLFSLADQNDTTAVEKICDGHSVYIDRDLARMHLPELLTDSISKSILVPESISVKIRFTMIKELNAIEAIALMYKYSGVDTRIIDDAFYQFFITQGHLENCRKFEEVFTKGKCGAWPRVQELKHMLKPLENYNLGIKDIDD